ncbi:MAG: efflux RND transporter periplasmic adaptor subunit [Planctomycetaceae bacterium]
MKRKIALWIILILVLAGAAVGYTYFYRGKDSAVQYRTVKVERGSISALVTANGTINPVITVLVGSQVSGTIQRLFADYNSRVTRGQLIAQIDPALFQAQVSQAKAKVENAKAAALNAQADISTARSNVESARANVIKAKVSVEDTKRSLDRSLELFSRNLISASDRDSAQTAYDSAQAQLAAAQAQFKASEAQLESANAKLQAARAQVRQAEAELESAQVNLDHTKIAAPVTGIVISRNVDVGQTVAASLQAPTLFTIAQDLTEMQVDTNVSEADIGRVAIGQEATFTVDAFPNLTFQGKVMDIRNAPVTVQNVVTYDVVIQVKNPELKLRPGMTANASILVAQRDHALKIPNSALRFRPEFDRKEAAAPQKEPVPSSSPRTSSATPEQILQKLKAELKLTPQQEAGVIRILKDALAEIQAAGKAGGAEEAATKAKELRAKNRVKIRSLLTEEQKKKYDQMIQRPETSQGAAPVFRVWTPVRQGRPLSVEITTGISDGSYTEVTSGVLKEGQEVIVEAVAGNNKGASSSQARQPSMRGIR